MPKVSLVVCLRNETAFLKRLLQHSSGCYDDLVVVHDGPQVEQPHPDYPTAERLRVAEGDWGLRIPGPPPREISLDYSKLKKTAPGPKSYRLVSGRTPRNSLKELVKRNHGHLYLGPRCFQQEPHWPFAWWKARHEWILRLDADEYPSSKMQLWLKEFRKIPRIPNQISGFTCVWPFWDGCEEFVFNRIEWRPFLFHKHRVSFFGMAEQGPIPISKWESTGLTLHHRPARLSFGLSYVLCRKQSYIWRRCIAASLMRSPSDLPRWRYNLQAWPPAWSRMIQNPWATGAYRFMGVFFKNLLSAPNQGFRYCQSELLGAPLHRLCISWTFGFYKLRSGYRTFTLKSMIHRVKEFAFSFW